MATDVSNEPFMNDKQWKLVERIIRKNTLLEIANRCDEIFNGVGDENIGELATELRVKAALALEQDTEKAAPQFMAMPGEPTNLPEGGLYTVVARRLVEAKVTVGGGGGGSMPKEPPEKAAPQPPTASDNAAPSQEGVGQREVAGAAPQPATVQAVLPPELSIPSFLFDALGPAATAAPGMPEEPKGPYLTTAKWGREWQLYAYALVKDRDRLAAELARVADTEADGVVFCWKCGKAK